MNQFNELHPGLSDPYATTEDKQHLIMDLLKEEVHSSINQNCTSPKLAKILIYFQRILGFRSKKGYAVPSHSLIEHGLLNHLFMLLFTHK